MEPFIWFDSSAGCYGGKSFAMQLSLSPNFHHILATSLMVFVLISLSSCSSTKPVILAPQDAVKLRGAHLATIRRETPPFDMKSLTEGVLGVLPYAGPIIGGLASTRAGNRVVESHAVSDPAIAISRELAFDLATKRGATLAFPVTLRPRTAMGRAGAWANGALNNKLTNSLTNESTNDMAEACPGSDYVLDVKTMKWSAGFYRTNWLRYRVRYTAQMKLIETRSGRVVAKGTYKHRTKKSDESPRYDTLLANDAARLKAELRRAAGASTDYFKGKVLGL